MATGIVFIWALWIGVHAFSHQPFPLAVPIAVTALDGVLATVIVQRIRREPKPRVPAPPTPSRAPRRSALIVGTLMPVVAILGGAFGIHVIDGERAQLTPHPNGATTSGTVVYVATTCSKGCSYQPTIEYLVDGQPYQITAPHQQDLPYVGEPVPLSYLATNPSAAHDIGEPVSSWNFPLFTMYFIVAIGVAVGISVGFAWRRVLRLMRERDA